MPRTKGSKNKVKAAGVDYENLIAAAQKEKEEAEAEVAKTNDSIEELKTERNLENAEGGCEGRGEKTDQAGREKGQGGHCC